MPGLGLSTRLRRQGGFGQSDCGRGLLGGLRGMAIRTSRPIETVQRYSLTRKEAATALGVSVDTFERRVQPFIRVVVCGQLILVPPAELERWISDNARFLT